MLTRSASCMTSRNPANPLTLQDKLDRISHERKVLSVLHELARHGLHDGDPVRHRDSNARGRVKVLRSAVEPHPVVVLDDGSQAEFLFDDWQRTTG